MIEVVGDLFAMPSADEPGGVALVCITTSGARNGRGHAIMGAGVAKQAKERWPGIERILGQRLAATPAQGGGNHVQLLTQPHQIAACPELGNAPWWLCSFPTKHHWKERSSIDLIERSARELRAVVDFNIGPGYRIALPRPGCQNGRLLWEDVRPRLAAILPEDRWLIVERSP